MPNSVFNIVGELLGLFTIGAATLAAVSDGEPSMSAMVGAAVASSLALIRWWPKSKTHYQRGGVFLASFFIGSIGPGAVLKVYFSDVAGKLVFESWMMIGFVAGAFGWGLCEIIFWAGDYLVAVIRRRAKTFIDDKMDQILKSDPRQEDPKQDDR